MKKNIKKFDVEEFYNVRDVVYNTVKKHSNNIAFVIKHQKDKNVTYENITYKRMLDDINCLGTAFYDLGLKNKRVAIIGKNRYEWNIAHFANLFGGIVSVPLDKDLKYDELESSLIRSKSDAIVFDPKLLELIKKIKENGNTNVKEFICMDEGYNYLSVNELINKGEKLIKDGKKDYLSAEINENDMAILLFTSGTTSKSKAVMLSHRNIASNIYAIQSVEDISDKDVYMAILPYHHTLGEILMLAALAYGAKTVFTDGLRYIKKNLNEYKVSVFVGVPLLVEAIYKAIMKEVDNQGKTKLIKFARVISNFLLKFGVDVRRKLFKKIIDSLGGNFRLIISGGAPGDPKIFKEFIELGVDIIQGYGLTETSPIVALESPGDFRIGSVGKPVINDTIEIVNKDKDGIGEIRVKGPNVMLGYYEMPEITNGVLKDGWFYTGDLGYFDKDGFLFITGRNKNMIVLRNGKKVFPEELETLVNRIELVSESMVFGLPSKDDKDDVKLSVKIVYNKKIAKEKYPGKTEDEIYTIIWNEIKELNKTFPRYKHIQNMILTGEELIKTTTKKVKRQEEMKKILEEK